MAVIELTNVEFYKDGEGGVTEVVGYESSTRRVARYTFTAPATGAQGVSLKFYTAGRQNGSHITLRFFIGEDPDSHVNAGAESEYTGELTIGSDWVTFTAAADIMLLPNKTYYLWVFPGEDKFGWYGWYHVDYASKVETEGAAFVIPVVRSGAWWNALVCCVHNGKWWLGALCVVKGGKWYLGGSMKQEG